MPSPPEEILREAETAFNKAARLFAVGNQEKSIIAFTKALELYSQVEGTERQQADCLNCIGTALRRIESDKEAVSAYRQALDLYRDLPGSEQDRAACSYNISTALHKTGRHEEALAFYQQAQEVYPQPDGGR